MIMKKIFLILGLIIFSAGSFAQVLENPPAESKNDNSDLTLGMIFKLKQNSLIKGILYFRDENFTGPTVGQIWTKDGNLIQSGTFPAGTGWIALNLPPISGTAGEEFVVTYSNDGGFYHYQNNYFPKSFPLYDAINSAYSWTRNSFPRLNWENSNYFVEPIIEIKLPDPIPVPVDPNPIIVRDTIKFYIDTCSIDYSKLTGLQLVLSLPEEGGAFLLPDSTTALFALTGFTPPHKRLKDDPTLIVDRFTRGTFANRRRITLYTTGAYIREKYISGKWTVVDY
jgi:hypothetical protein